MNYGNDKATIQEVKIASSGGTALLTLGVVFSLGFNAYTLLKVAQLANTLSAFIEQLKPILLG